MPRIHSALTLCTGLLLILVAGTVGMHAMVHIAENEPVAESEQQQKVWADKCAMCHGKAGVPTPVGEKLGARNLTTSEVQDMSDQELRSVIVDGSGKMPGYKDTLSSEEIDFLLQQIRSFALKPAEPAQD